MLDITSARTKSALSPSRQWLIAECQRVNFGRIRNLNFCEGQPVRTSQTSIEREIKFGGEKGPRPEHRSPDFLLKDQVVELLALLDEMRSGVIDVLEVKHGLPFRASVTEASG